MSKPFRAIPLLSGGTLTGHVNAFRNDRLPLFSRIGRAQRDIHLLRFINVPVVAVSGPDACHEILVDKWKSFAKSVGIRLVAYPLVGEGLFSSEGELWRRQRKLMAPLFHPSHVEANAQG